MKSGTTKTSNKVKELDKYNFLILLIWEEDPFGWLTLRFNFETSIESSSKDSEAIICWLAPKSTTHLEKLELREELHEIPAMLSLTDDSLNPCLLSQMGLRNLVYWSFVR